MENFFYEDKFCTDIGELMEELDIDEDLSGIDDDWAITCMGTTLEPVFQLSADWIVDRIDEERYTEVGEQADKIHTLIGKHLDFTTVNSLIPKVYYPGGPDITITKKDLLDWIN